MVHPLRVLRTPFQPRAARDRNASGVVYVGEHRFVFVDNRDGSSVFELLLDADGNQRSGVRRRRLTGIGKGELGDPEGLTAIALDGVCHLVVSSSLCMRGHGSTARPDDGLVRVRYVPDGDLEGEVMAGFRGWLLENYPELTEAAEREPDDAGLNIEGLAWDPAAGELLFGLRSPTTARHSTVLRIHLDTSADWTVDALTPRPSARVRSFTTPAQGIRDIAYDAESGGYLVLLGRAVSGDRDIPFELCTWDGTDTAPTVLPVEFARSMKPEGVAAYTVDGVRHIIVVDDAGGYAVFRSSDIPL